MAEYLAPGVYVEEIDSGPQPIEGVSTSTAGMVGMAERGPTDIPILVTSAGEYERWFGGLLDDGEFTDPTGRLHCYLPYAVDGFFTNGGKRLYVVRVAPAQAQPAALDMFWRDPGVVVGETVLLRAAGQGTGDAAAPLYVLTAANLNVGDRIRIGDGSASEYMTVAVVTAAVTRHIPLGTPVTRAHPSGSAISEHAATNVAGIPAAKTLASAAANGATELFINSPDDLVAFLAGPPAAANRLPWLAQLSLNGSTDLVPVTAVENAGANVFRLVLNQPLNGDYPLAQPVGLLQSQVSGARVLATAAVPGDLMIFADANGAGAALVELDQGGPNHEAHLRGSLTTISLAQPLPFEAPIGSLFEQVALADDGAIAAKATTAAAAAGSQVLALDNRVGLAVGQTVRIGVPNIEEFATIIAIPGGGGPTPDAGQITIAEPLGRAHASGSQVQVQQAPAFPAGGHSGSRLVLPAVAGDTAVLTTNGTGWAAGDFARVTSTSGDVAYARIVAPVAAAAPAIVELTTNLVRSHAIGEPAVEREDLFQVQALDSGAWGNRLRVSAENEPRGLAGTNTGVLTPPLQFTVDSLTGLEAGSLIEMRNPTNGASIFLKVRRVDYAAGAVILDPPGLNAAALAALGPIVTPLQVQSREFRLTVHLQRRPDPAVPSRNTLVLTSETFPNLSMDHRHSRYFQRVIGATNGPPRLEDNRPDGESAFVRVLDTLQDNATEVIRTGPETIVDLLPGGLVQPARHALSGGDDSLATMANGVYLGADNAEPRLRTGLASLRNLPEISLVAIPGQTQPEIQSALISHCETMLYRFAILDALGAQASIADVRLQRQQFDSKYAALYYPWLTIPDPMPANLANIGTFALPPSGHVLGLIARVDNERGVHKAPANEVVRGITGITRVLQKAEHDILNPSPVNVNVIRDFRPDGRSIRVFGARCITSDQEYKYINVRRLLIFLEQSIEIGLQWVVFEPNAEPLWARVEQSISNFLTDVWNGGALEGAEPAQGFFVKCDRTTMTQSQIDNGQLVALVGVAPVKPAEFVIIRIGLTTRTADAA